MLSTSYIFLRFIYDSRGAYNTQNSRIFLGIEKKDAMTENLPDEGLGPLQRQRYLDAIVKVWRAYQEDDVGGTSETKTEKVKQTIEKMPDLQTALIEGDARLEQLRDTGPGDIFLRELSRKLIKRSHRGAFEMRHSILEPVYGGDRIKWTTCGRQPCWRNTPRRKNGFKSKMTSSKPTYATIGILDTSNRRNLKSFR